MAANSIKLERVMNPNPYTILVVDDEENIRSTLKRLIRREYGESVAVMFARNGIEALKILDTKTVDLAIVDLQMPEMDGFALLKELNENFNTITVLILTGNGSIKDAVKAIGMGATDFLEKPFHGEEICARIDQCRRLWNLNEENKRLKEEIAFTFGFEKLLGTSPAMLAVKRLITQAGLSDVNVLIQGDTGTGKELVARALHYHSKRRQDLFVPVDCASLSSTVVESELFGYVKGAFTGASGASPGLIRAADGGTVFFDEIGELPLSMQVKLLRVLQEKEVRPVGGTKAVPVDVRILAATNRDLEKEVAAGRFREDLFYRLNVILLAVPSLRERKDDISTLVRYFIVKAGVPGNSTGISQHAMACLERYDWPGNVRELENVLRRAVALRGGDCIEVEDLPAHIAKLRNAYQPADELKPQVEPTPSPSMDTYELTAITSALAKSGGNRKRAAAALEIGEATLYRKIRKYKLD